MSLSIEELERVLRVLETPLGELYLEQDEWVIEQRKLISKHYNSLKSNPWPEYDNLIPGYQECSLRARATWLKDYLDGRKTQESF